MSAIGSENLTDDTGGSGGSETEPRPIEGSGESRTARNQAASDGQAHASGADEEEQGRQSETPARTVTRTTDRSENGVGEERLRTTTRLVTQTGATAVEITISGSAAARVSDGAVGGQDTLSQKGTEASPGALPISTVNVDNDPADPSGNSTGLSTVETGSQVDGPSPAS